MAATITCYGSVGEIGGNKILLEDGEARIFFDFGTAFGRQGMFYNELLRPRPARGLLDPLVMGLIPPLHGIYRKDLEIAGLWERLRASTDYRSLAREDGRPGVDGVLLSHAHLDHNGEFSYLDGCIPIYTTRLSAFIARAMQVTGFSSLEREMVYLSPRLANGNGELITDRHRNYGLRPYCFLDGELSPSAAAFWQNAGCSKTKGVERAPVNPASRGIGGLNVKAWPVDHSIPGAAGFAVETSAGWIGYTGDIRFHGENGESTCRFMEELACLEPVALLCEGTHLHGAGAPMAEAQIAERALPIVRKYAGKLVIADFGPRNIERLFSFLRLAKEAGRILLAQPKDVYMLQAMHLADAGRYPAPETFDCLGVFADPKTAPRAWEYELRQAWAGRIIGPLEISRSPGSILLAASLWDLNDLPDLVGIDGGAYLFSNSRAYDDEQRADLDRLRAWVRWLGLTLYGDPDDPQSMPLHASGHATGSQLVEFVHAVRPKTLIPIHTEEPDWWQERLAGIPTALCIPQEGMAIQLT